MAKMLFGSFGKILYWIVLVLLFGFICSSSVGAAFGVFIFLLIPGPCVTIPAMIAAHGKHVVSSKSVAETKQIVTSIFNAKKTGRAWTPTTRGPGEINYEMLLTQTGCEPVVSVDVDNDGRGSLLVSAWMSEWASGGLNGGKGTPFWVWGGFRAMTKVSEIAKAVA